MNTCKQCIHFDVCPAEQIATGMSGLCLNFKDKAKFIELELLYAKQAIFKLIGQSCRAVAFEDKDGLYVYDYCESAFEAAFNVLGIEEDCIELSEFCQMWEDNDRAIWAIKNPDVPFNGIIAEMHYKIFSDDYDNWVKMVTEEFTEDEDY